MKFRKIFQKKDEILEIDKIVFILGPRQVGKTTFMKYLYSQIETKNKYFLNLENFKNQEIFVSIENFEKFIKAVYDGNGKFYLFLDEFHKVKNIDQFLKIIYDDYPFVKIIASGSSNLEVNKKIKESLAGRKRVYRLYPLDFEEFLIWKEGLNLESVSNFLINPINKKLVLSYLEEFLIWGGYPEVVLTKDPAERKQVLEDIFSFWFNKDIILETEKIYEAKELIKYLSFSLGGILNMSNLANFVSLSVPTIKRLVGLFEETFIIFLLRPFFRNKLKELKKAPKIYFFDFGFRNRLIDRFLFSNEELGYLFENFIIQELLKKGYRLDNLKFWRTKDERYEVDLVIENKKLAIEIKCKTMDKIKQLDYKGLKKFNQLYPDFKTMLVNLDNFYEVLQDL